MDRDRHGPRRDLRFHFAGCEKTPTRTGDSVHSVMGSACIAVVAALFFAVLALAVWGLLQPEEAPFAAAPVSLAEARDGDLVRVTGWIRDAEAIESALGEEVALFHLELREPGARKESGYSRVLEESGVSGFVLEDDSGRARVDTRQVTLLPPPGAPFSALDERARALLDRRGRRGESWQRGLRQRYVCAKEGDPVSVVGRCRRAERDSYRTGSEVVLEAPDGAPLLIRIEWPRSKRTKRV